jgi:uncharacterized protein
MPGTSFLAPARNSTELQAILNDRTGRVVASAVELADRSETRRRGLLGRDSLDPSAALIIVPCSAVHTFFMRFVIDVVFVDRSGTVLKAVAEVKPWRIALRPGAFAVVELNAGAIRRSELKVGDRLTLRESTLRA